MASDACELFNQETLATFNVVLAGPAPVATGLVKVEPVSAKALLGSASLNNAALTLPDGFPDFTEIAYFSTKTKRWKIVKLDAATHMAEVDLIGATGVVYARSLTSSIFKINWKRSHSKADAEAFKKECISRTFKKVPGTEAFPNLQYAVCLDAANDEGVFRAVYDKQTVVAPNNTGAIIVQHLSGYAIQTTTSGSSVALTTPTTEGVLAAIVPAFAGALAASDPASGEFTYSIILIPPHAPGAFHIDLKLVDGTDATKVKGTYGVDFIVDQPYSGGLRIGFGYLTNLKDENFSSHKLPGSDQSQILSTNASPIELVLGYTLYLDAFGNGRTYGLKYGTGWEYLGNVITRHLGVYVGVGVLGVQSTNVDFLKSIHVGLEVELSRNISFAITYYTRRSSKLPENLNLHVGGPAPDGGDIPGDSELTHGLGLVVNVTSDFFKFAVNPLGK